MKHAHNKTTYPTGLKSGGLADTHLSYRTEVWWSGWYPPVLQDCSRVVWLLPTYPTGLKSGGLADTFLSYRTVVEWSGCCLPVLQDLAATYLSYRTVIGWSGWYLPILQDCSLANTYLSCRTVVWWSGWYLPILQDCSLVVWLTVLTSFLSPLNDPVLANLVIVPRFLFSFFPEWIYPINSH